MIRQIVASLLCVVALAAQAQTSADSVGTPSGPVRLRQPAQPQTQEFSERMRERVPLDEGTQRQEVLRADEDAGSRDDSQIRSERRVRAAPRLTEFERFVQRATDTTTPIRRFGHELMTMDTDSTAGASPVVPADYVLSPGDELIVSLWGSVDADLRLVVDRSGRINIPRVGPVMLSGVRYADAPDVVRRRVASVFRNFDVSVSLAQLRGIRIFVTGFVDRPGSHAVSSLSTLTQGLMSAGGPSAAGSFRQIELRRAGSAPVSHDLYELLLRGDRSRDVVLQPGDVIHVGPVGRQVAVIGSVNRPAIFELKPQETVSDAMQMAGGFTAVADRSRVAIERLSERTSVRIAELKLPKDTNAPLDNGDIVRAFSAVDAQLPQQAQAKRVRIEGEVARPGEYVLPPNSFISDALAAAGGVAPAGYIFGTEFTREAVRIRQQENYERALRDLEAEFMKAAITQRTTNADEANAQTARAANTTRLMETLRALKPTGRVVLQVTPDSTQLPDLALQDGDRIVIPARPSTVGVFGSVFNGGSYLFGEGRSLSSYMALAGGPTRGADAGSTFVIRANGSVVSSRQGRGWFGLGGIDDIVAQPGDTIFVPEEINKTTFIQNAKDWTQILYQFGVGIAAIATLR